MLDQVGEHEVVGIVTVLEGARRTFNVLEARLLEESRHVGQGAGCEVEHELVASDQGRRCQKLRNGCRFVSVHVGLAKDTEGCQRAHHADNESF
jgi:hypothetical protein